MPTPVTASILFRPTNWLEPFDWPAVFGDDHPVEVDVGAGKGAFLLWAAATRPEHNFLGIERLLLRLRKVDKKARRQGLANVRLVRLEASYLIAHLIPPASVTAYHIYFPDPWPKRRHQARRLVNATFAGDLWRTLRPGGAVNAATDHEEYFRQIEAVMAATQGFVATAVPTLPVEARTDFEQEFLAAGKPVFRGRWEKR